LSGTEQPLRRIDHIAVRGFAIGSVRAPRPPVSDHRPVIASLRLTG
jgi:endonuclease/exonuclease/phosphatase family metal-dependent hydrolase